LQFAQVSVVHEDAHCRIVQAANVGPVDVVVTFACFAENQYMETYTLGQWKLPEGTTRKISVSLSITEILVDNRFA
jgi:hypothetical protein